MGVCERSCPILREKTNWNLKSPELGFYNVRLLDVWVKPACKIAKSSKILH